MSMLRPEVGGLDVEHLADAACRGTDPALWFPGPQDAQAGVDARLICAGCPVADECRDTAGEALGIRGGLSLEQRKAGMDPAEALERAKRKAGWKPCLECRTLFPPSRRNHRLCGKPCWNRRAHRLRYQQDPEFRAAKQAANREYQREAAEALRKKRRARYWADPEKARAERRARYRASKQQASGPADTPPTYDGGDGLQEGATHAR